MELKSTLEVEAILEENEKLLIEWKALQYKAPREDSSAFMQWKIQCERYQQKINFLLSRLARQADRDRVSKAPPVQSDPSSRAAPRGQATAYTGVGSTRMNSGIPGTNPHMANPHQAGGRTMATASSMPMMMPDDLTDMYTAELPPGTNTDTMPMMHPNYQTSSKKSPNPSPQYQ